MSFNFAPKGWALCNGQTLPINQNQALFSLLGTTYGGNGTTTFQLPNLQASSPVHWGTDLFGNVYELGQSGGETAVTLVEPEMPEHMHQAQLGRSSLQHFPGGKRLGGIGVGALQRECKCGHVGDRDIGRGRSPAAQQYAALSGIEFRDRTPGNLPVVKLERYSRHVGPVRWRICGFPFNFAPTGWAMCNGYTC